MVSTPTGRRTLISPLAFTGRATPPAQPDPITTKLLNQNSLQLGLVASQINNLNTQVASLNTSLQVISTSLATSQALERQKEAAEQAQQARLAQQQLREGQESIIEKKIENAAVAPAQKLASKAQFTLGNLGGFFLTLIGGWLSTQAIDAINAQAEGNTDKLNEIKATTITGLATLTGVFVASRLGLKLLSGSFGRIGITLAALAAVGLFTQPGRDFIEIIKNAALDFYNNTIRSLPGGQLLPQIGGNQTQPNQTPPNQTQPLNPTQPPGPQQTQPNQTQPQPQPQPVNPTQPPGIGYNLGGLVDGKEGIDQVDARLTKGEFVIPKNQVNAYGVDFMESIRLGQSLFATNAPDISSPAAQVQPMENMSGEKLDPAEKAGHKETLDAKVEPTPISDDSRTEPANVPLAGDPSKGLEPGQISPGDTTLSQMGFSVDEVQSYIDSEKYISMTGNLPQNMFTPILKSQKVADIVSEPPPEQPINVVPIPITPPSAPAQESPPQPVATGNIGNIPVFSTSDSSNIHRLNTISILNVLPG